MKYDMREAHKHKTVVVIILAFFCSAVLVGRYGLFYEAMYQGWLHDMKTTELHAAVSTLIYNIEQYIEEEQHSDPERSLRFMHDNAKQCEQEIDQITSFCAFVVTGKSNFWINENLVFHNEISRNSLSGLVKSSDNLSQGLRIFQGFLRRCMDNDLYIESDEQLKNDLSVIVQELNVLNTVLMEHDFNEIEGDTEFIACYLCFLDESSMIALNLFSDFQT